MISLLFAFFLQSIELAPGSDATAAIQAEIDRVEAVGHGTVRLPQGTFKISDTLHLGHGDKFTSISLIGAAEGIPYGTRFGTTLEATFSDRPIVNIQGGRGNAIRGIQFLGPNSSIQFKTFPNQDVEVYARVYPQHSNQQFAGVSIDAFSGQPPAEPRYRGMFGKRHTSMVSIEGCQFRFLGCGIITKPSGGQGADAQGDYLLVSDCNFQFCQWGASVNGSQTRQSTFRDCKFWDCYTAVGIGQHGTGLGGNVLISGGTFDRCGYGVFARKAGWSNRISIRDTIGEETICLADIRDGMGICQVLVDGGTYTLPIDRNYRFTPYHIRADGCLLDVRDNVFRTYGESYRPTFLIRGSTEIQTNANIYRRATIDQKDSPLVAIIPSHQSTIVEGKNASKLVGQTRVVGRAEWLDARRIKGAKTLDCKIGEVYGMALIGDKPCDVFRVVEVDATSLTVEVLSCGLEVNDKAATLARYQDWANFVWRIN
jgi:hypothetical protein